MAVETEQHDVSTLSENSYVTLGTMALTRAASGTWSLRGRVRVQIDLGDGRMIWGFKPFLVSGLSQQGRKGA